MDSTEVVQAPPVGKLQVVDRVPKVIEKLQFGVLSAGSTSRRSAASNYRAGLVKTS